MLHQERVVYSDSTEGTLDEFLVAADAYGWMGVNVLSGDVLRVHVFGADATLVQRERTVHFFLWYHVPRSELDENGIQHLRDRRRQALVEDQLRPFE